jgi:2'-5' RNA ligase
MDKNKRLFFIALLPPQEIQDRVTEIKEYFAKHYHSRHALKSPPHVTLQPPFKWPPEKLDVLQECLREFACEPHRSSIPITLSGFGAFGPRVIYINVLKTPELLVVQKDLMARLEDNLGIVDPVSKKRPFAPHTTVAFKDLSKENFRKGWEEFKGRSLHFEFTAPQLTLLMHNGGRWEINSEFPF